MALHGSIGGKDYTLFIGEDKALSLHVKDEDGIPVNIAGWVIKFIVRRRLSDPDPAVIEKTATIAGTYNADPVVNTQRANVILTDTDLTISAVNHHYSWKRTDDTFETVLRHGLFVPVLATQV